MGIVVFKPIVEYGLKALKQTDIYCKSILLTEPFESRSALQALQETEVIGIGVLLGGEAKTGIAGLGVVSGGR